MERLPKNPDQIYLCSSDFYLRPPRPLPLSTALRTKFITSSQQLELKPGIYVAQHVPTLPFKIVCHAANTWTMEHHMVKLFRK